MLNESTVGKQLIVFLHYRNADSVQHSWSHIRCHQESFLSSVLVSCPITTRHEVAKMPSGSQSFYPNSSAAPAQGSCLFTGGSRSVLGYTPCLTWSIPELHAYSCCSRRVGQTTQGKGIQTEKGCAPKQGQEQRLLGRHTAKGAPGQEAGLPVPFPSYDLPLFSMMHATHYWGSVQSHSTRVGALCPPLGATH